MATKEEILDAISNMTVLELSELLKAQFGLRMQIATQQLNNTAQLKKVRRDIARVKTVMNQKDAK